MEVICMQSLEGLPHIVSGKTRQNGIQVSATVSVTAESANTDYVHSNDFSCMSIVSVLTQNFHHIQNNLQRQQRVHTEGKKRPKEKKGR